MFQFSGLSPLPLWVQSKGDRPSRLSGLPIGRSTGRRLCAPHRGLSQLVTSFIGFLCQGIHRTLLTSCLCLHSFANNKQRHLRYIRCSVAGIHTCCAIFRVETEMARDQMLISQTVSETHKCVLTLCGFQGTRGD